MNHKMTTTAIMTAMVALVLTAAAFTVPTLHAQAWGFFGNRMTLDQQINQLNKCKSLSSEGKYNPTSYEVNTSNQPTTESNTDNNHTSTDSISNHASAVNQTSTDSSAHSANSGWYSNNNKNSNDAGNDNNKPSDNNGGYNDNNNNNNKKPSSNTVLCSNKATNLATIG
jgi:hypothetical protein